ETGAAGNIVTRNVIGTDIDRTFTVPNGGFGVHVTTLVAGGSAPNNVIGGMTLNAGNVVSGNSSGGIAIEGGGAIGTMAVGNRVGTDTAGATPLANGGDGVLLNAAAGTILGGATTAAANVLSGNDGYGVHLSNGATQNLVEGNLIGLDATGTITDPDGVAG